jgi:hypothetical protein
MTRPGWSAFARESLRSAGWAPALVFVGHVMASQGFDAYRRFPPLDIPMHLLGGAAIAFFFAGSYRIAEERGLLGSPASWLSPVVAGALAVCAGVFWEFAEFLSDRYFGTRAQLGLDDTLLDMALGCLGSFSYLALSGAARAARRR